MIVFVIGASRAGKSSYIKNTFLTGSVKFKKDILPYCETDSCYIIGDYEKYKDSSETRIGLDKISKKQILDILPQVIKLYNVSNKDIILDGDKAVNRNLMNGLLEKKCDIKIIYIRCSTETSISRSKACGIPTSDSTLKALRTKADNFYYEYEGRVRAEIIDTDEVTDFTVFSANNLPQKKERKFKYYDDFAVFILTHGRAENISTIRALHNCGYTGRYYLIIDDEDDQADLYREKYGDKVVQFNKQKAVDESDPMDLLNEHRAILYVRRECFKIAKQLGVKWFLQLDDDFTSFSIRTAKDGHLKSNVIKNLDKACEGLIEVLRDTNALTIAMCQPGDFIGGINCDNFWKGFLRKAMNSFFCNADRPIDFKGTMNEDVTAYVMLGSQGNLILSHVRFCIGNSETQSMTGGMTEVYIDSGTYVKSFYSVMACPSCVKIGMIKDKYARIHHNVLWEYAAPKIISEEYKK